MVTFDQVWSEAVQALAFVRVVGAADVQADADADGGDVRIKSKDAEVVVSLVEEALGGAELAAAADLGRMELTSLRSLSALLWRRWRETKGVAA